MVAQAAPSTETAIVRLVPETDGATKVEQVVIEGNLASLSPTERVSYYRAVCESVGLNPLTKPFEYITLNGKLTLYANRGCTDQLRQIRRIEVVKLERERADDLAIVIAYGRDGTGRQDSAMGAVSVKGLQGEALANALMKAETKAKRRMTLSLSGLGMLDEVEVDSVPGAWREEIDQLTGEITPPAPATLAERIASQAAAAGATPIDEPAAGTGTPAIEPASVATGDTTSTPVATADAPRAPATAAAPSALAQCAAVSPYGSGERCGMALGHSGNHKTKAKESWS